MQEVQELRVRSLGWEDPLEEGMARIDHIMGHKASLGKFKKIEIIPSIFSDHNAVRLDA